MDDIKSSIAKSIAGIIEKRAIPFSAFVPSKLVLYRDELDDIAMEIATIIITGIENGAGRLAAGE